MNNGARPHYSQQPGAGHVEGLERSGGAGRGRVVLCEHREHHGVAGPVVLVAQAAAQCRLVDVAEPARNGRAADVLGIAADLDPVEADALSKLGAAYAGLYRTEDFIEGRKAEAEGRPPKYQGK